MIDPSKLTPEEVEKRRNALRTQGVKGLSAPRINVPLTEDNDAFLRIVCKSAGLTKGQAVNRILTAYRMEHPDIQEKAAAFFAAIDGLFYVNQGEEGAE